MTDGQRTDFGTKLIYLFFLKKKNRYYEPSTFYCIKLNELLPIKKETFDQVLEIIMNPLYTGNPETGTFTNSEDQDEMPQNAAFHQGQHCLL